jgi:hypothetical protein
MSQSLVSIIALVAFVVLVIDVWRSPADTGPKVIWTVLGFIFSIITLIVWFVWGRKKAYGHA